MPNRQRRPRAGRPATASGSGLDPNISVGRRRSTAAARGQAARRARDGSARSSPRTRPVGRLASSASAVNVLAFNRRWIGREMTASWRARPAGKARRMDARLPPGRDEANGAMHASWNAPIPTGLLANSRPRRRPRGRGRLRIYLAPPPASANIRDASPRQRAPARRRPGRRHRRWSDPRSQGNRTRCSKARAAAPGEAGFRGRTVPRVRPRTRREAPPRADPRRRARAHQRAGFAPREAWEDARELLASGIGRLTTRQRAALESFNGRHRAASPASPVGRRSPTRCSTTPTKVMLVDIPADDLLARLKPAGLRSGADRARRPAISSARAT